MNSYVGKVAGLTVGAMIGLAPFLALGGLVPEGGEHNITGGMIGDQVHPSVAVSAFGGYLAWQDNSTDGDGIGIRAVKLDANFNPVFGAFRISQTGAGDQENVKVEMLDGGGAVFVWQGGPQGSQDIYARVLGADGEFAGNEFRVNTYTQNHQENPAAAQLQNGNLIFAWESMGQDGDMRGVYSQITTKTGAKVGSETLVNLRTSNNQKSPAIGVQSDGSYVIAWAGEEFAGFKHDVDPEGKITGTTVGVPVYYSLIYGRLFDGASGGSLSGELMLTGPGVHANPSITVRSGGGFDLACSRLEKDANVGGWNIVNAGFDAQGNRLADFSVLNEHTYGDQYNPHVVAVGDTTLGVWSSVGQGGSKHSVYARSLAGDGPEFRVNTTYELTHKHPASAGLATGRLLVVWVAYDFDAGGFEVFGQRYREESDKPAAPGAPFVSALSPAQLSVTWPEVQGYDVVEYLLYIDGSAEPVVVNGNTYSHQPLMAASTHEYRLAYRLADGALSSLSTGATGTTFGADLNFDGLPDDWQRAYWPDAAKLPSPLIDSDGDGATNLQEFLSGTNPADAASVLMARISVSEEQGWFLNWNTTPGYVYQVQISDDLHNWVDIGERRFAAEAQDSLAIGVDGITGYYRVTRIR